MCNMEPLLTPKDLEKILKVGKNKVYELLNRPDFPAIKIGSSYRVQRKSLEEYLGKHTGGKNVIISQDV